MVRRGLVSLSSFLDRAGNNKMWNGGSGASIWTTYAAPPMATWDTRTTSLVNTTTTTAGIVFGGRLMDIGEKT